MTKIAGSGSIGQRNGSADPDPDPPQNVMDSQHWFLPWALSHFHYLEDVGEAVEAHPLHVLHLVDGEGVVLDQLVAPDDRQPSERRKRKKIS